MPETRRVLEPLQSLSLVASNSAIQSGRRNRYNANAGALTPPLPPLGLLEFGTRLQVQKFDSSANTVTITCSDGDEIANTLTTLELSRPLETVELMVGNDTWELIGHYLPTPRGVLVTTGSAQVLTGKTIDGAANTFLNVPVGALGTGKVVGQNVGGAASLTVWVGTAAQYAAIPSKSATTLYFTTE